MVYLRAQLKQNAKQRLSGHWGTAIGGMLLASVVPALAVSFVTGIINGFASAFSNGEGFGFYAVTTLSSFINLAFSVLVVLPLAVGLCGLFLNLVRGNQVTATTPYGAFNNGCFARFTMTMFMTGLFAFLWGLLLIIPGIIKAYSYAMAPYLVLDHPDYDWHKAIGESKTMMNGHKGELFVLDLSFIGWFLLSSITFGIVGFFAFPYYEATKANFYRGLLAEEI